MFTPAKARGGNSPWPPSREWLNKAAHDAVEYDSAFKKKEVLTHGKCREGEWEPTYLRDLGRWLLKAGERGTGSDNVVSMEFRVGGPGDESWGCVVAQQCVWTHCLNPLKRLTSYDMYSSK